MDHAWGQGRGARSPRARMAFQARGTCGRAVRSAQKVLDAIDEVCDLTRAKTRATESLHVPLSGNFRLLMTRRPATTPGLRCAIQGLKSQVDVPASYPDSHAGQLAGVLVRLERSSDPSDIRNGEGTFGPPDADGAHPGLLR